jgi:hypothetical protein
MGWWSRLLIRLLVLLPLALLLAAPATPITVSAFGTLVCWLALLFCFWGIFFMPARTRWASWRSGFPKPSMPFARWPGQ